MKKLFILSIILSFTLLPNIAYAVLVCNVTTNACPEATIFRMSSDNNAHAENASESNYAYNVCCGNVTGLNNLCDCVGNNCNTVLKLSSITNAHVEKKIYSNYATDVCISGPADTFITCDYADAPSDCSDLAGGDYVCVASMSADTDAHVGNCSTYPTKVCCRASDTSPLPGMDITIRVEYPFVDNFMIPLIPYGGDCNDTVGCANFTKTMPIDFIVTATVVDPVTGYEVRCIESNCEAFYDINATGWKQMNWNEFSAGWRATPTSKLFDCNTGYHELNISVNYNVDPISNTVTKKFFVSCEEKLTVDPIEKTVPIGTEDLIIFNVTIWNPIESPPSPPNGKEYDITMGTGSAQGFDILGVLEFCQTPEACSGNDNIVLADVGPVSYRSAYVNLSIAGRSGIYEIKFTTTPNPDTDGVGHLEAYGVLAISSESLNEFSLPQLLILTLISAMIFGLVRKENNLYSKKTNN